MNLIRLIQTFPWKPDFNVVITSSICTHTHTQTHKHTYVCVPSRYFCKMVDFRPFLGRSTGLALQSIGYALLVQCRRGHNKMVPLTVNVLLSPCQYFPSFLFAVLSSCYFNLVFMHWRVYADTSQRSWMSMQEECLAALTLITNYLSRLTFGLPRLTGGRRVAAATSLTLLLCV
jgi:hypothetical protein